MKKVNQFWGKIMVGLVCIIGCSLFIPVMGVKAASLHGESNEEKIFYFFREEMNFNTAADAGVLANIEKESSFRPGAVGDNGSSYGICQWHNDRASRLRGWCGNNGYNWQDLEGQLNYLAYELKTYYPNTLGIVRGVDNSAGGAFSAGHDWCYYFEIPADKERKSNERGTLARDVYWPKYKDITSKLKKGKTYVTEEGVFKATGDFEVMFKGMADKGASELEIPNKVLIGEVSAKVTSIAPNACKKNKNVENVTIGTNVTKIGKNAFYGCSNLQEISIKSKKIKTFSKNCFKKIADDAEFYVKGSSKKKYAKMLKKVAPKDIKVKKL
ncbi:phage tail tip lysozyme [Butyrivibrio sp. AE3004]|uniref:phage tail tip lysozyme n=1 Tax=Butyrivibrio sp. AE3004 TaxID=1506994 RepID=UPI000493D66A|nr:phage tail tip lysozyme [Butyrivibrio sp. AE3004]